MQVGDAYNPRRLFRGIFIPEAVARMPREKLSPGAKMAFGWLSWRTSDDTGECSPAATDLAEDLGVSERQVRDYLGQLEREGFIRQIRRGPDTNEFEFSWHDVLESCLRKDRNKSSDQEKRPEQNPDHNPVMSGTKVPISSFNVLEKETQEEPITSMEFSNERLTPDVTETDFSDEPAKSKKQTWSSKDQSNFWALWKRKAGSKPNANIRKQFNRWLDYKDPGQALTAINGYALLELETMSIDEFKRGYWEYFKLGNDVERATTPPPVPSVSRTTTATPPEAPSAPNAQHGAILMWNEIVVSNPIDPPWDNSRDRMADFLKATQDPVFIERLPEICAKAEEYAKKNKTKSRSFRWMIKSFGPGAGNWWDFLHQEEAPRFKVKETPEERTAKIVQAAMKEYK